MGISKTTAVLLGGALVGVHAVSGPYELGFGILPESFEQANQNPLNRTSVTFPGFNLSADAGSNANATSSDQWTWNAGLSIINTDTNETNYPISSPANTTSNVINIAYTMDFPGDQLPVQNDTDWTICSNIVSVPWTDEVLQRAANDPGDCSVVLGESILNQVRQGWSVSTVRSSSTGCPDGPSFTRIDGFDALTTNGYAYYTSSIMSFYSDPNNRSSPLVGLKSGQIFSYERSDELAASDVQSTFDEYSTALRMMVLTFTPSQGFITNLSSGAINSGEVRTFCTILNKEDDTTSSSTPSQTNAAPSLDSYRAVVVSVVLGALFFAKELL